MRYSQLKKPKRQIRGYKSKEAHKDTFLDGFEAGLNLMDFVTALKKTT